MKNWNTADVIEFLHDRGYSVEVRKLMRKHTVNGRGLIRLVKDATLLSALKLHPLRAQRLISDVEEYKRSGSNEMFVAMCVLCFVVSPLKLYWYLCSCVFDNSVFCTSICAYTASTLNIHEAS